MRALFWIALINGLVAVPLMIFLLLLVSRTKVIGAFTASKPIVILRWTTGRSWPKPASLCFCPESKWKIRTASQS